MTPIYDTGTNGIGRLSSVSDSSGTTTFTYDNMGRATKTDKVVSATTYTTQSTFDLAGRVSSISYPQNSGTVAYTYNGPVLYQVKEGTTTYATYVNYNAQGQPGSVTFGNNVATLYTYSNTGNTNCPKDNFRLCTITTGTTSATYQSLRYDYDAGGNVKSIADPIYGNQSFGYDELNRLNTAVGSYGTISYTYDQIGNMMSNSQVGSYAYPTSGSTSVRPHAVSSAGPTGYSYDNNGNMISGAGRTIGYDAENRPLSITVGSSTTNFVYDGDGGRVKKTVGGLTTVYIGKLYECSAGSCSKYIFAGSQRIALKSVGSATIYYYHADHLGSSSVMTDGSGNAVEGLAYFPYGATRTQTGSVDVHHKFTSQELDDSTGLYFYGARYYDAVLGRFISADTVIQSLRNPQSLNRYAYALNNPMIYTDPSGHMVDLRAGSLNFDFNIPMTDFNLDLGGSLSFNLDSYSPGTGFTLTDAGNFATYIPNSLPNFEVNTASYMVSNNIGSVGKISDQGWFAIGMKTINGSSFAQNQGGFVGAMNEKLYGNNNELGNFIAGQTQPGYDSEWHPGGTQMFFDFDKISELSGGLAGNLPGLMVHESVHALDWFEQNNNGTVAAEGAAFGMQVDFNNSYVADMIKIGDPFPFPARMTQPSPAEICQMYSCP